MTSAKHTQNALLRHHIIPAIHPSSMFAVIPGRFRHMGDATRNVKHSIC